ncbi:uncharacterized protein B0H18DRAFT_968202 [Fomitopsis serialis]|uniref:uncharacterized protein n=1 Tax=Fomitopsis serialis TaxID=139415 RepID=UPI002008B926|nr:uncharacterized protein B0H18DRAFT_968202 [Neoantrodia serialis]KAH9938662.1 hypothetical protein B0H18DRAFT_968202 [Neoantrodia serialis]
MARIRRAKSQEKAAEAEESSSESETLAFTEEEQWRIKPPEEDEEGLPLAEEIFNATLFIIPMSFLLLLMEILVHWQYGKRPTYQALADRMLPGVPILSIFIFYTARYKRFRWMQFLLFILSLAVGPRLIWLINMASWRVVMQQVTRSGARFASLVIIGSWLWYSGMKIIL